MGRKIAVTCNFSKSDDRYLRTAPHSKGWGVSLVLTAKNIVILHILVIPTVYCVLYCNVVMYIHIR